MVGFRLSILYHRSLPNRSAYFMHPCFVPDNSILESDFRTYPTRFSGIPLTCRELRGCRKYNLCRSQRGRPFFRYPSPLVIHHLQPRAPAHHRPRPSRPQGRGDIKPQPGRPTDTKITQKTPKPLQTLDLRLTNS